MAIRSFENHQPVVPASAWVDEAALVIGDVELGADTSLWPFAVARGDVHRIRVGARTNIQDHSVLHVSHESPFSPAGAPLTVGDDVTVGHRVILHGCTVGNRCLIGMGAIIMDGAVLDDGLVLAAGSLVASGKELEGGYLWRGSPARRVRELTAGEQEFLDYSAQHYVALKNRHRDV